MPKIRMAFSCQTVVICFYLICPSQLLGQADSIYQRIETIITDDKLRNRGTIVHDKSVEASTRQCNNRIEIINYINSGTSVQSQAVDLTHSKLTFLRQQKLLGLGFQIGADVYLQGGVIDDQRSGILFRFSGREYREDIYEENRDKLSSLVLQKRESLSSINEDYSNARIVERFDKFEKLVQSKAFKKFVEPSLSYADSLYKSTTDTLLNNQLSLAESAALQAYLTEYDSLLLQVQDVTPEARNRLKKVKGISDAATVEEAKRKVLKEATQGEIISTILAATNELELGNTRLSNDGLLSIGLPIRGISFATGFGAIRTEVQYGKRIRSNQFIPRGGGIFHDQHTDARFFRGQIARTGERGLGYKVALLSAREQRDGGRSTVRDNRVGRVETSLPISKRLKLLTSVSYAGIISALPERSEAGPSLADAIGFQAGLSYTSNGVNIEATALRRGTDYVSLANPYLLNDIRGFRFSMSGRLFNNCLSTRLSLEGGRRLIVGAGNELRLNGQGYARFQISRRSVASLLIAPNIYRTEILEVEQQSTNSIFQLSYEYATPTTRLNFGYSNLSTGLTWRDSTTVETEPLGSVQIEQRLGQRLVVGFSGQQQIIALNEITTKSTYQYRATIGSSTTRIKYSLGLLRQRRRGDRIGGWGFVTSLGLPLSNFTNLQIQLFYRQDHSTLATQDGSHSIGGFQRFNTTF